MDASFQLDFVAKLRFGWKQSWRESDKLRSTSYGRAGVRGAYYYQGKTRDHGCGVPVSSHFVQSWGSCKSGCISLCVMQFFMGTNRRNKK